MENRRRTRNMLAAAVGIVILAVILIGGTVWTARSSDGKSFSKGERVTVEKIEGVKLIVKAMN